MHKAGAPRKNQKHDPTLPEPPPLAVQVESENPLPIHFNQTGGSSHICFDLTTNCRYPVVLQCLSTGVVSPLMIIREVGKPGTHTCFGGDRPGVLSNSPYTAPGEGIGEPVSQLQKICFEMLVNPETAYQAQFHPLDGFPGCSSFLTCNDNAVGVRPASSPKTWVNASTDGPISPMSTPGTSASNYNSFDQAFGDADYSPVQRGSVQGRARALSISAALAETDLTDGGKVKKHRRGSSASISKAASSGPAAVARSRQRNGSISGPMTSSIGRVNDNTAASRWVHEIEDRAIWSISGVGELSSLLYMLHFAKMPSQS